MLLMIVMGMLGIYRGLIQDATLLIEGIGADLWVVQSSTRGPFAEMSRVPRNLVDRVAAVPGVLQAREFVYHTIQRERAGRPLRMGVLGLSWPTDKGDVAAAGGRPRPGAGALRDDRRPHTGACARGAAEARPGDLHRRRDHGRDGQPRAATAWPSSPSTTPRPFSSTCRGEAIRLERAARRARTSQPRDRRLPAAGAGPRRRHRGGDPGRWGRRWSAP